MKKKIFLTFVLMLSVFTAALSQVTTSAITGKVSTDENGEAVIGATVQAVHEPSGTRYATVTNIDGRYTIQGMRVGGPYKVTISYVGYRSKVVTGVNLKLGETYSLNEKMEEDANQLGEVVVSASASKFTGEKTGATTNISSTQMQNLPTISRSISDIARISPYANGMSFAGGDGRSTNFTLDGANLNNNFGLTSGLPGGGNPISMDAIDEVQVVVAPYDVRQTNFIGGGINAVTKSGTNKFKGTAYMFYNNENMHGNRVDNTDLGERGTNRNTTYGFTFGGPIIKNKLFFFANAEYSKVPNVANRWRASDDGKEDVDNYISRTKKSDLDRLSAFLKEKYGYDTGSYDSWGADEDNLKLLGRIDWNITNDHHLAVRFNHTANKSWFAPNGNSSDTGFRLRGMDRLSQYSMSYANSMYSMNNKVTSVSADLNSRFGDKLANQLLFTYTDISDERGSGSSEFPFVDIMNGYETQADGTVKQDLSPYISFGYELFSYNNRVQNKITNIIDNFTWYAGDHKVTAGINFEHQLANNSYMRGGTGYYRYRSLDDFINGAAPETVGIAYGYNGASHPNAEVKFNQYGIYVQDEWNVLDNLKLNGGIRFDNITFDNSDIMTNNAIKALDFGGKHIDTGKWPKANVQISPRIGFVWDVFGNKQLKVRGGTGLFAGRLPLVFFTNMPTNSGMIQQNPYNAVTKYNSDGTVKSSDPLLDKFRGGLVTDRDKIRELLGAPATITPDEGTVAKSIGGVDRNFKMPQVWKSSIAVDWQAPVSFPLTFTAEFTYTKKINDVMLKNYNIKDNTSEWEHLKGADNRLVYPKDYTYYSNLNDACVLTNTHKGHGYTFNFTATAEPVKNLNLMAAYTHTMMKEISGMPGSNASSAWSGLYTVNGPNFATLQNSQYVIPDRIIANVSYKYGKEHFSLFYTGYSPAGYSFYYNGDLNGDGIKSDLMYIPKDDSEINFSSDADRKAFWAFVNQDKYLKNHKGEYAGAYSARAPFVHRFDFRWAHDFDFKIGSTTNRLQLSLDIMNVGNLFNSKWGVAKNMASCNNGQILKIDKIENNTPVFSMMKVNGKYPTETWNFNHDYDQCWMMQIGVKYIFN
ncbi:MAG TPA: TonB-dependent receptor [Prevotella sp.]|nr:TonB-dependent receptor [Prevotella sp.]